MTGAPRIDTSVAALWPQGSKQRRAVLMLLHHAREDGWRTELVEQAVSALADKAHRSARAWAAEHVDKGRQVRAAMARAEDCTQHGADLRFEQHQAYSFSRLADAHDQQRMAWIETCYRLVEMFAAADPDRADAYRKTLDKASSKTSRIRDRNQAPTLADCQRAGRCEHPHTTPHGACQQLALFDVEEVR